MCNPELPAIEATARARGANLWRLITIDQMGRQADGPDPEMWLDRAQLEKILAFVGERRRFYARRGQGFGVRFSCGGFLGLKNEHALRPEGGQCYAGLAIASILADGQVGACPSIPREINAQGSARKERFSSIWHRRFEDFRDLEGNRGGICGDCSYFEVCLGGGYHERAVQPRHFCWIDRQDGLVDASSSETELPQVPKARYRTRHAAQTTPTTGASELGGVAAVVIFSEAPEALANWYERAWGLRRFSSREDFIGLGGAGQNTSLFVQKSAEGHAPGQGGVRPHFRVQDIHRLMARLVEAGAEELWPLRETDDAWIAAIKDPEGNALGLLQHKGSQAG